MIILSSAIKYRLAASAVVLLSLCSCGEDGVDGPVKMTCTDLVTFSGNVGERATFTFQKMDDSPEITLTAQSTLASDDIEAGTRLLISYIPEGNQAYVSGPVTLLGGRVVTQSAITAEWRDEYDAWDKDKVYVYSAAHRSIPQCACPAYLFGRAPHILPCGRPCYAQFGVARGVSCACYRRRCRQS